MTRSAPGWAGEKHGRDDEEPYGANRGDVNKRIRLHQIRTRRNVSQQERNYDHVESDFTQKEKKKSPAEVNLRDAHCKK